MKINDSKISNSEKLIYKANILLIENTKKLSIYSNKNQNYKFGEIIEVDACQDRFFGTNEKIHIYHAIDAKSGALVALWAEKEETNKGYQKLLEILFQNYGLPETIISDKRRTMWGSEFTETAFKKSLNSKNINLFTTSNPKGKPNVEHSFKNAQRSYPYYFSKQNINIKSIKDIQENQLKITKFYNEKYKRNTIWKDSSFRVPSNPNSFKMDLIIDRKINAGVVQYNNKYYCPFDERENRVGMKEGSFIQLCLDSNGDLKFIGNGKRYDAREPKGKQLTPEQIFAIKNNLNLEIEGVNCIYKINMFINKNNQKLFELNQKHLDQQNKTTIEIIKNQTKIYNELIEINQKINDSIWQKI
ncbi:hypothetical protein [Ureaplasma parvum]|uniref:hypothetical protein n=1 Tax=Ureaplasma parvum TaxID=134821 RepID=UPI0026EF4F44|nr:hypothetical protein [Ureaplasma parvum]